MATNITKDLSPLQKQIETIAEKANTISITSKEDMREATIILSIINKYVDSVKEQKEQLTKPINVALNNIRTMFKPLETTYEQAIADIRAKMTSYHSQALLEAHRAEEAIASSVENGNIPIETAIKKMSEIQQPDKETSTDAGLVQFRDKSTVKVTNIDKIPREYFDLNETRLLKALKDGTTIEGAEIEIIKIVANYR